MNTLEYPFLRATSRPFWDGVEIHIMQRLDGKLCGVPPIEMRRIEDGTRQPPALTLTDEKAQQLMDDLWQCGLRPSEGSGSAGALAATQRHLDDMRSLVFKTPPKSKIL